MTDPETKQMLQGPGFCCKHFALLQENDVHADMYLSSSHTPEASLTLAREHNCFVFNAARCARSRRIKTLIYKENMLLTMKMLQDAICFYLEGVNYLI